jgi:Uma2 family endonuclease
MARRHVIRYVHDDGQDLRIPEEAFSLEGFQRWTESTNFPDSSRIDYLKGNIEIELSPEDLYTHSAPKTAITLTLGRLLVETDLGEIHVDRTRNVSWFTGLSVEPDLVVVLFESLRAGRVRPVPSARNQPGCFIAVEGPVDVMVEIVSDGSIKRDTKTLPPLYARAGVPEMWLIDARGEDLSFEIRTLRNGRYKLVEPDSEGWTRSPRLARDFRLHRYSLPDLEGWRYRLEDRLA